MIVDEKGRIVADLGIRWLSYDGTLWWSIEPYGYRIEMSYSTLLWRLYRKSSSYNIGDQTIFIGHTKMECMRVAEIYEIRSYK